MVKRVMRVRTKRTLPSPFRLAKRASLKSLHKRPMGAVVVEKSIISTGWNIKKTHPILLKGPIAVYSLHCEVMAILHAKGDLKGTQIYVYREDKLGHPRLAKPCPACRHLLKLYGIKVAWYTTELAPYYDKLNL